MEYEVWSMRYAGLPGRGSAGGVNELASDLTSNRTWSDVSEYPIPDTTYLILTLRNQCDLRILYWFPSYHL